VPGGSFPDDLYYSSPSRILASFDTRGPPQIKGLAVVGCLFQQEEAIGLEIRAGMVRTPRQKGQKE
jgi:hypothetical protein